MVKSFTTITFHTMSSDFKRNNTWILKYCEVQFLKQINCNFIINCFLCPLALQFLCKKVTAVDKLECQTNKEHCHN